jgi:hypothetical protein
MVRTVVNLIYSIVNVFIEMKLNANCCKSFLKDLLLDSVDTEQLSLMGGLGDDLKLAIQDYKASGVAFDSKQVSLLVEDFVKHIYASRYYLSRWLDRKLTYEERQSAKDSYVIREMLCSCIKARIIYGSIEKEISLMYNAFKADFETYKVNTRLINSMFKDTPNDNEGIREAIKERIKEAKNIWGKYGEIFEYRYIFNIDESDFMSVLEDDILHDKGKTHLSELEKTIVDLVA